jgi:hypothetical protein
MTALKELELMIRRAIRSSRLRRSRRIGSRRRWRTSPTTSRCPSGYGRSRAVSSAGATSTASTTPRSRWKALNNIAAIPGEGLYLLKDIHRFLDKPDIVRKLQDLGPGFAMDRRVMVLCASHAELPRALQSIAH